MFINLVYIFLVLVAIYYGISTYVFTKKWQVFPLLGIFLFSLILEFDWMNKGNFLLNTNDFLRTLRDIIRTIVTIVCMHYIQTHFRRQAKIKKQEQEQE